MKILLTSLALIATLFLHSGCSPQPSKQPLILFCAAGLRLPVAEIAKQYEADYGIPIQLQFAGSGTLLSSLDIAKGHIYLAADASYTGIAQEKGLLAETLQVCYMTAGFGVAKGNPKNIHSLADLQRNDLRVGISNPEAASIGKLTKKVLSGENLWDELEPDVLFPTVNELANALKLGTIDVAILWDALANQFTDIDFVNVPAFDAEKKQVTLGILATSDQPTEALRFSRYLTSRDKGMPAFQKHGYETIQGDVWAEKPEIVLFSGSMLRPAIENTIEAFEEREGITITTVYNGCGILVSQMKSGEWPDAYFSCDVTFLDMVQDEFEPGSLVSANELVILVPKGNPKNLHSLEDLARPGLKLGLSHPEKSALGFLTKRLLESEGLYQAIIDAGNLTADSATGDFLVNQMRLGSLDGAIVYRSNALANPSTLDDCEVIGIGRPKAVAEQPFAVSIRSPHHHLMNRFLNACVSGEGREAFLQHGFRWEWDRASAVAGPNP